MIDQFPRCARLSEPHGAGRACSGLSRRLVLAGMAGLLAAPLLAACAGSGSGPAPRAQTSGAATTASAAASVAASAAPEVKAGQVAVQFMSWGDETRQKVRTKLANTFNAAHPDIVASWTVIPSSGYGSKLLTMVAGNVAPDIFMLSPTDQLQYATKGIAMDLSPLLQAAKVRKPRS